jgi:DNA-binding response OmpR family regulator
MAPMRILLVEDDARMRALVRRGLIEEGHAVESAGTMAAALELAEGAPFDVIVVDVMLPGPSGLALVQALRRRGDRTPALMLTARDAVADDYLTKPFALRILLARLRALARRTPMTTEAVMQLADLELDGATHTVRRGGALVPLTRTEFNLLECLMRQAGRVVTRERLMTTLWSSDRDVGSNTLDAFVKSLRHKVDTDDPRLIHTIRGVGYCLRQEPEP